MRVGGEGRLDGLLPLEPDGAGSPSCTQPMGLPHENFECFIMQFAAGTLVASANVIVGQSANLQQDNRRSGVGRISLSIPLLLLLYSCWMTIADRKPFLWPRAVATVDWLSTL